MTIIEKLENKIKITKGELEDIVRDRCSSISELIEEIHIGRSDGYELLSTYFKTKKW